MYYDFIQEAEQWALAGDQIWISTANICIFFQIVSIMIYTICGFVP